jgi:hypothetical protein
MVASRERKALERTTAATATATATAMMMMMMKGRMKERRAKQQ